MIGDRQQPEQIIVDNNQEAWVLDFGAGIRAAVAYHEMSQILLSPPLFSVPLAPSYCDHVLNLRNKLLPVFNLSRLLAPIANPEQIDEGEEQMIGVAVYQVEPGAPLQNVCLYLNDLPENVTVNDDMICDLPSNPLWELFSISCFSYENNPIPLIDLSILFSAELRAELNARDIQ